MRMPVRSGLCAALGVVGALAVGASPALAASPWWHVTSRIVPSNLKPGGEGTIVVEAINIGDAPSSGPITLSDALPAGVMLQKASLFEFSSTEDFAKLCTTSLSGLSCTYTEEVKVRPAVLPYEHLEMLLSVKVEPGAASGIGKVRISGGGASSAAITQPVAVSEVVPAFGVEDFTIVPEEEGGAIDARAGSHPYQLTATLTFNRSDLNPLKPPALPRNLQFKLPPGQIGNATALPQCNATDFAHIEKGGGANRCSSDTAIGVAVVTGAVQAPKETPFIVPVFNLTPALGEPARFGFEILRNPVILDTAVRSGPGEDYGVTINVNNITQLASFLSSVVTFWGAPADPSHNESRGWGCIAGGAYAEEAGPCIPSEQRHPAAFLTLPTNCSAPFTAVLEGVSWPLQAAPGGVPLPRREYNLKDGFGNPLAISACNQVPFGPTISAAPTTDRASAPSGLDFNLNFDDEGLINANGVAQSQLNKTVVTLPEGLTINPSAGVGLGDCTLADYAAETIESAPGAGCPNNAKLGTVEIETPLLAQTIHGSVFIAQPHENPFNSLVAIYIVAKNPETGVLIKLAGKVTPNPVTGQLTTTFENNPQLPFDHFNLHFREGQQAPLISPPVCGAYDTVAELTPWSDPTATLTDTSPFTITKGFDGGACPAGGVPPFNPQIQAGTLNNNAGAFSSFYLRLTRTDADEEISSFSTSLPPGLAGVLTGIPFCPVADIALARTKTGAQEESQPSCPAASQLGHSLVGAGAGAVLAYTPGKVYLAGPYNGDPFSLVSVTSAVVGPFDLGTVVIRFGLRIDPHTAQVSVDPTASEPIPTIIQGIVTHVRDIRVYMDRPSFTFNPTSCTPMAISSTLTGNQGTAATVSSPFQAASCANLKFQPKVSVTTGAKTSKANGASLNFKISYPKGAMGSDSWFKYAKFDIPKQLPARLTTIQKACLAKVFESNPAACPPASLIGHAIVHTQVLPVPLEGPVYFVSYGGEKFPDAVLVLKGYGITVDLVGQTFINGKTGITSATFASTPDVPFESIEVTVPSGPFSEFGANLPVKAKGSLCGQKLVMPTRFKAQNGLEITQNTRIGVTGCPKAKTRTQLLKAALAACHRKHSKGKRTSCEKQARRRYGR